MWSEALLFFGRGVDTIFLPDVAEMWQLRLAQRPESCHFPAGGQKMNFRICEGCYLLNHGRVRLSNPNTEFICLHIQI